MGATAFVRTRQQLRDRASPPPGLPQADAVTILSIWLLLLFAIPSRLVFAAVGAAGRPAIVVGLGLAAWWGVTRFLPSGGHGRQPVRWAVLMYLVVTILAYASGFTRPLPGLEVRGSDRFMLITFALGGVALVAADGVSDRERLDTLLRRLTYAGAALAVTAGTQFFLKFDVSSRIKLPGLALSADLFATRTRGVVSRVAGLTAHPIELGAVLALIFPIAVHYALHSKGWIRVGRWCVVAIITVGAFISVSRTAVIGLLVAMLVLVIAWPPRRRFYGGVVAFFGLVGLRGAVPGLLGTIRSLFENATTDTSVTARTDDFGFVGPYIASRPWLGRGPGTFSATEVRALDNQFLKSLVELGVLGALSFFALFVVGLVVVRRVRYVSGDDETRHLARALAAAIWAALVASFLFDALFFTTFAGTLFLVLGCVGALWRLEAKGSAPPGRSG